MAPKKAQKMSLNAFLEDSSLGSWADEMDALPTAPAPRTDEDRAHDRDFGRRGGDYLSTRPDRGPLLPAADVPLPTQPPYTAFVGNLSFDVTETELEGFFGPGGIKSVKILKDREDKPRGFGYVEFSTIDGLKDAIAKSGSSFCNRTVRISVAEPQKERAGGFGGSGGDDDKFSGDWRRGGPLPEQRSEGRDGPRRRMEPHAEQRESASDQISDWRSATRGPPRFPSDHEPAAPVRRRGSGFSSSDPHAPSPADTEETWTIGSKFKQTSSPGGENQPGSRFGSMRGRGDMGPPPAPTVSEESDWRKLKSGRNSTSPTNSVPSTPQMGRRKLELKPRSSNPSGEPTPLSSPKSSTAPHKPNPFGSAKPVDVSAREAEITQRLEKGREEIKDRVQHHNMSRQSSQQARTRGPVAAADDGKAPADATSPSITTPPSPSSPRAAHASISSTVRPTFSFASAAAAKREQEALDRAGTATSGDDKAIEETAEKLAEVSV